MEIPEHEMLSENEEPNFVVFFPALGISEERLLPTGTPTSWQELPNFPLVQELANSSAQTKSSQTPVSVHCLKAQCLHF